MKARRSYEWFFRVNTPTSLRQRIGQKLADLLSRFDGRTVALFEINSDPVLAKEQKIACIKAGFDHTERMLELEVKAEATEYLLRKHQPEFFE